MLSERCKQRLFRHSKNYSEKIEIKYRNQHRQLLYHFETEKLQRVHHTPPTWNFIVFLKFKFIQKKLTLKNSRAERKNSKDFVSKNLKIYLVPIIIERNKKGKLKSILNLWMALFSTFLDVNLTSTSKFTNQVNINGIRKRLL